MSRAGFARLVAVLAALVGIALIEGAPCHAAMSTTSMAMQMSVSAMDVTRSVAAAATPVVAKSLSDMTVAAHPRWSIDVTYEELSPAPAGVMMACLAAFLALLAVVVMVRPGTAVSPVPVEKPQEVPSRHVVPSRKPNLHELCILRT